MDSNDYAFDPDNPWICQEFILQRKDFRKDSNDTALAEKPFDNGLIGKYNTLLDAAFSFQIPRGNLDNGLKYLLDLSTKQFFIDSFRSFWKDNELVGFYWLNENLIDKLVVAPDKQRLGYGSYMLNHAFEAIFANSRYDFAYLTCMLQNKNGLSFYRKLGLDEGKVE